MKRKRQRQSVKASAGRVEQILEEARKQPGISELLEVYQSWQRIETVIRPHRFFMGQQFVISASNSSALE